MLLVQVGLSWSPEGLWAIPWLWGGLVPPRHPSQPCLVLFEMLFGEIVAMELGECLLKEEWWEEGGDGAESWGHQGCHVTAATQIHVARWVPACGAAVLVHPLRAPRILSHSHLLRRATAVPWMGKTLLGVLSAGLEITLFLA